MNYIAIAFRCAWNPWDSGRSALSSKVALKTVPKCTTVCQEVGEHLEPLPPLFFFALLRKSAADCLKAGTGFTVIRCVADQMDACCKARVAGCEYRLLQYLALDSLRCPVLWPEGPRVR